MAVNVVIQLTSSASFGEFPCVWVLISAVFKNALSTTVTHVTAELLKDAIPGIKVSFGSSTSASKE